MIVPDYTLELEAHNSIFIAVLYSYIHPVVLQNEYNVPCTGLLANFYTVLSSDLSFPGSSVQVLQYMQQDLL
jgi:hypothetical protein